MAAQQPDYCTVPERGHDWRDTAWDHAAGTTRRPIRASDLTVWLTRLLTMFGDRVLAFDVPVAQHWGRLSAELGHDSADLIIAATALQHGLTVVTGNVKHFEPTGVENVRSVYLN